MTGEKRQICISIIEHYGAEKQSLKSCEELGELIRSISRLVFNHSKENLDNLKEEIADVLIMVEQLKYLYGIIDSDIDSIITQKLNRTLKRIKEEVKNGI